MFWEAVKGNGELRIVGSLLYFMYQQFEEVFPLFETEVSIR